MADWAVHIFREADSWAAKGVRGREYEWVDTAHVVWSEVTGLCVFWDGSCDNGKCGAGILQDELEVIRESTARSNVC